MSDLLQQLYYLESENGFFQVKDCPGYYTAKSRLDRSFKTLETVLDPAQLNGLYTAMAELMDLENNISFRRGFHLAGRLLRELHGEL